MDAVRIDVWSDIACPWCWVGKRNLETALDGAESVQLVWRAFELNPNARRHVDPDVSYIQRLAKKYGVSEAEGQAMVDRMTGVGAEAGLEFRFDRVKPTNTFDAHRLVHWAQEEGRQIDLKEAFFQAYMTDGKHLGEADVLVSIVESVGLDGAEAKAIVDSDRYADGVRQDELMASELQVRGVPFFVFAGRLAVPGAQPADVLRQALQQAFQAPSPVPGPTTSDGVDDGKAADSADGASHGG